MRWLVALIILVTSLVVTSVVAAQIEQRLSGGDVLTVLCDGLRLDQNRLSDTSRRLTCVANPTPVPPTPTPPPSHVAWHGPSGNTHEHGDAPPAWVLSSNWQPFTQSRESHEGYKGALSTMPNGVQSYFIGHIVGTIFARSHGDHDYQLWIRDLQGNVSYWQGVNLGFSNDPINNPMMAIHLHAKRTGDTDPGTRPIVLGVDGTSISQGLAACETWYSKPGYAVLDVGWTICGMPQDFDGVSRGDGTFRTIDWILIPGRFPGRDSVHVAPTLADDCQVQFGVCRFTFLVNSRDYGSVAGPN